MGRALKKILTTVVCAAVMVVTATASSSSKMIPVVEELSSSLFAGRLTGTSGNDRATHYIASLFAELGLEPMAGLEDYHQEYTQPARFLVDGAPQLAIVSAQGEESNSLQYLEDFVVALGQGLTNQGAVTGSAVVLRRVEQLKHLTTGLADLPGRVLLIPESVFEPNQNEIMQHLVATSPKPAGLIIEADIGDQTFPTSLFVTFEELDNPAQLPLLFSVRTEAFWELVRAAERGSELRMVADYELTEVEAKNVVGLVPGRLEEGPVNDRQYVIIGAHFDGAGSTMAGTLNPSAHDNASGVAVLLECAALLRHEQLSLDPTVVFVAFNGEEQGMYGSRFLASHWPYPKDATIMINIDSVGAKKNDVLSIETGPGVESTLQLELLAQSHKLGIPAEGGQSNGSDHRSFAEQGIPAINLIQADHSVMHRMTDNADVLDEEKLEQVVRLILTYLQGM